MENQNVKCNAGGSSELTILQKCVAMKLAVWSKDIESEFGIDDGTIEGWRRNPQFENYRKQHTGMVKSLMKVVLLKLVEKM